MGVLAQIVLFIVFTLFISCENSAALRQTEPIYNPRYAEGFSIERDKASGEVLLCVKNPWQGAENICYYYPIDTLSPAQRIVTMSSSHAAMLDAVGCSDRIVGLSGCRFVYNSNLCKKIAEGKIGEVGYDSNLDFEKIYSLRAEAVLLYGVSGEAKMITNKLDELRTPYIYIGEYLENNPLGKAEWVVALAYLCGVGEQGKEFFKGVEERYNALRNQKHCSAYRPRVMLNLPYRDSWFMPPHNSYMVQLIEDAGGEYILKTRDERRETRVNTDCKQNNTTNCQSSIVNCQLKNADRNNNTSTPISLEEALVLAMKADFWINLGQISSKEELCAVAPRFAEVDAVKFGRIYNNTKRTNESRGSDFWESGCVRPDLILADLVKILHYEAPTDSLYYYKKME
ncbi:MAG: iron ABC transporter substrate-binding protein [Rikenellaceae bacterium]|nr:iron ABC transporter substrate-binding protein [Rikenellaceae bacterium]